MLINVTCIRNMTLRRVFIVASYIPIALGYAVGITLIALFVFASITLRLNISRQVDLAESARRAWYERP